MTTTAPLPHLPPTIRHHDFFPLKKLLYPLGVLCLPLFFCLLLLITVFHSSLVTVLVEIIYTFWLYGLYLSYHRHDVDPYSSSTSASDRESAFYLSNFYLPVLLSLLSFRAAFHYSIAKKIPHTSERKRRVTLVIATLYLIGVGGGFYSIVKEQEVMLATASSFQYKQDNQEVTDALALSALIVRLYYSTLVFTLLTCVSVFWVPTSDTRLRDSESHLLRVHTATIPKNDGHKKSASAKSLDVIMKQHYAAHHAYVLLHHAADEKDTGSDRADENEGQQIGKKQSPAPAASSASSSTSEYPPLVFLHGYGAGKSFWFRNLPEISARLPHHKIYALDLRGMGSSSHVYTMANCVTSDDAEEYFMEGLEAWRKTMGIQTMILVGHSFGGLIAGCYTLRYPQHVSQVIFASPVGMPETPLNPDGTPVTQSKPNTRAPWWIQKYGLLRLARWLWSRHITLSQVLHWFGPLAPPLFRYIVKGRFAHLVTNQHQQQAGKPTGGNDAEQPLIDLDALATYCYHLNAGACPGHAGLNLLLAPGAFAHKPLLPRILKEELFRGNAGKKMEEIIEKNMGVVGTDNNKNNNNTASSSLLTTCGGLTFIYGSNDWMDVKAGAKLSEQLMERAIPSTCKIVNQAGHQLYIENAKEFNKVIVEAVEEAQMRREAFFAAAAAHAQNGKQKKENNKQAATEEMTDSNDKQASSTSASNVKQRHRNKATAQ